MLQAMLRKQCCRALPIRTYVTNGLRKWLSYREILTFRNARARIRIFPSAWSTS